MSILYAANSILKSPAIKKLLRASRLYERIDEEEEDEDDIKLNYTFKGNTGHVCVLVSQLPSCCAIILFHDIHIDIWKDEDKDRLYKQVYNIHQQIALKAGYTMMMCTLLVNDEQDPYLKAAGWVIDKTFTNARTGNKLNIWSKQIKKRK